MTAYEEILADNDRLLILKAYLQAEGQDTYSETYAKLIGTHHSLTANANSLLRRDPIKEYEEFKNLKSMRPLMHSVVPQSRSPLMGTIERVANVGSKLFPLDERLRVMLVDAACDFGLTYIKNPCKVVNEKYFRDNVIKGCFQKDAAAQFFEFRREYNALNLQVICMLSTSSKYASQFSRLGITGSDIPTPQALDALESAMKDYHKRRIERIYS